MNYLITGTDTGVGKTFVTTALIRLIRSLGFNCVGMKPICTGDKKDVLDIASASGNTTPEHLLNPVWYRTPVAPYTAAMIENRLIDLLAIRQAFETLAKDHSPILVEGAGGIAVPIQKEYDFRDLAKDLSLTVVLVTANRLGAINHTRLTFEAIQAAGLTCALVLLNSTATGSDVAQATNRSVLEDLLPVPVMTVDRDQSEFAGIAAKLGFVRK